MGFKMVTREIRTKPKESREGLEMRPVGFEIVALEIRRRFGSKRKERDKGVERFHVY
jgi:hypothetical protein